MVCDRCQVLLGFPYKWLQTPQHFCEFTVALWGALRHSLGNIFFIP